jgi:hypothetical protein
MNDHGGFVKWLDPWYSIVSNHARVSAMERELQREVAAGHPMFGLAVNAIGSRCDCDDVLFRILDGTNRVAVVHLSWPHHPPDKPPWPHTTIYDSLECWALHRMQPDHEDYTSPQSDSES